MNGCTRFLSVAVMLACASPASHGAGFQMYAQQSVAAMSQGAAVVARSGGPACAFYNPAGLGNVAQATFDVTLVGIASTSRYTPPPELATTDVAGAVTTRSGLSPLGAAHVAWPAGESWGVGLAVDTPYGSRTEWNATWTGRYYADVTRLSTVFVAPAVGVALRENLLLGAGLAAVWGEAQIERAINAPMVFAAAVPEMAELFAGQAFAGENDVLAAIRAEDWGYGYRLGLQWRPWSSWSAGVCYHSAVDLALRGRADHRIPDYAQDGGDPQPSSPTASQLAPVLFPDTNVRSDLELPPTAAAGLAWGGIEHLMLEVDLVWTGWSSYAQQAVVYDSLAGEADHVVTTPKGWSDVWAIRLGAELGLSDALVARAGYVFDQSPIPDATRDPSLPASDRHNLSLGLGVSTRRWSLDVGYLYVHIGDASSELSSPTQGSLTGDYRSRAHVFGMGGALHF